MARYVPSNGRGWSITTRRPCERGCRIWPWRFPWPWRRRSAGLGWPICWRNWAIPSTSAIRRPDPLVIGPSDAAYPFCAGRVAMLPRTEMFRSQAAAPTRRDSWFSTNRRMLLNHTGLPQFGHKLMRRRAASRCDRRKGPPRDAGQAHQLVDPRRRSGRTPALPYPPPGTISLQPPKTRKPPLDRQKRFRDRVGRATRAPAKNSRELVGLALLDPPYSFLQVQKLIGPVT